MKALTITWVALLRLVRDRSNIFFVFVLPIGIILIIGAQFGGGFTPTIGVVVEESAGELGEELASAIGVRDDVDISSFSSTEDAVTAVERGTVQAAVVIPSGYDDDLASAELIPLVREEPQVAAERQVAAAPAQRQVRSRST